LNNRDRLVQRRALHRQGEALIFESIFPFGLEQRSALHS